MTYTEWAKAFCGGGGKEGLYLSFRIGSKYIKHDGAFDLEKAKAEYEEFLKKVPKKYRDYLQQSLGAVEYEEERRLPDVPFAYSPNRDTIYYDPGKSSFNSLDFSVVNTHELAHRIDGFFFQSWEDDAFSKAIEEAKDVMMRDPEKFIAVSRTDKEGFLTDILDALCESKLDFTPGHDYNYWQKYSTKEREIFANLFCLESFQDQKKLDFIEENFKSLILAFKDLMM